MYMTQSFVFADLDKGSPDSDIDETLGKPAAKECSKNHDDE